MDKQSISETNEQIQGSKHILTTIIAVILTAVIVGSGIYVWQESNLRRTEQSLRQQLIDLENQIKNQKTTETIVDNTEEAENIIEKPSQTVGTKKIFSPIDLNNVSIQHDDTWKQGETYIIKTIGTRSYMISFQNNDMEYLEKDGAYAYDLKLFKEVSLNGKIHYVFTAANEYGYLSSCPIKTNQACSPRLPNGGYLFVMLNQYMSGSQYPVELDFNRNDDKQILAEFSDIMATLKY